MIIEFIDMEQINRLFKEVERLNRKWEKGIARMDMLLKDIHQKIAEKDKLLQQRKQAGLAVQLADMP